MSKINIIYLLPESKYPVGGAKVIYNHSYIINNLDKKFSSKIIHLKKGLSYKFKTSLSKRINFLGNNYSGWEVNKMKVSKNFLPDREWYDKKIYLGDSLNFNNDKDFIILPEIWAHFAFDLGLIKKKINYSIFVQGFYHMNSTNNYKKFKYAYENAKSIITVSDYSVAYLKKMFPKMKNKIQKLNFSLSDKIHIKKKKNLVAYMPRKLKDHSNLLMFYLKDMMPKNWKIIALENISEKKLFEILAKSKIFLSFSHLEGTGIPPIEAALSGNKIIGYTGGGGNSYWKKPIFTKVENGEIYDYGQKVLNSIKKYNSKWIKDTYKQRVKLSSIYSKESEKRSLKKFTKHILKFF